jgi:recombination protein RecA
MAKKESTKTVQVGGSKEDKEKSLKTAIADIEKRFGSGTVMYMNDGHHINVETVSTGSLTLDLALGVGGLPKGRITEIFGPESGGKTTVALHCVAEVQKLGGQAAYIDVEHALDPQYAKDIGVNIDSLLVSQPDSGEQALEIIEALIRSGAVDVVVLDSVAAMTTKAEIEGNMGDATVGMQARLMSSAMRKLTAIIGKTNTIAIFINQIREKIGISYGNPETTPGGRALKFYASVRLDVRPGQKIEVGDKVVGRETTVKVVKNKVAPPFKKAEFDMIFGKGISKIGEILDVGESLGIVKKSGSWFSYNGERIGQGREKSKDFLSADEDISGAIEAEIKAKLAEMAAANIQPNIKTDSAPDNETPDEDSEETAAKAKVAETKPSSSKKKKVVIETDEDFEEFSPDEL